VTLDCITGFSRERERFIRPSAVSVGYAWAMRGLCPAMARPGLRSHQMRSELRKHW
jgi:hypothetical protein